MALDLGSNDHQTPVNEGPVLRFLKLKAARRITTKERMFFTEKLALLLETGNSLHASLSSLEQQADKPAMRELTAALAEDIANGFSFSQALARHPDTFSHTYINLVAASETGGFMHQVLEQLLEMDDKREKLRSTLLSALSYPAFLLVFAVGVVIFVLAVVFPKFKDMFSTIYDQLPSTTRFLMGVSDILQSQWPTLLGILLTATLSYRYWAKSSRGRYNIDRLKLNLPVIGPIIAKLYLVQSLRVMGLSLSNGVSVADTLQACREVIDNHLFHQFIVDVEARVQEGGGLAAGFRESDFIPPVVEQMITTGEETGNLPRVMSRLADFYEREMARQLATFNRLIEPIMLLVMGGVVGLLVSSLILPIFKLSRAVH